MKKRAAAGIGTLLLIWVVFFYKFFALGLYPFPGDLLISTYQPWKSYSYLGYNPGSYPTKYQYFDTIRQTYPWRAFALSEVQNGRFPLWNPHNFSGHPLFANIQSSVLYPFNAVYFIADEALAWALLVSLQPLLASSFVYLFARKKNISRTGAVVAGIAYGYCLFTTVFLEYNTMIHVVAWLPFMLYMIELLAEKWRFYPIIGLSLSVAIAAFAGHLQLFGLVAGTAFVYAVWMGIVAKKPSFIIKIAGVIAIGVGISLVQLIPTIELLRYSARVDHDPQQMISEFLIQPWQISLFFAPDLFGNPATGNYTLPDSYPGNALYVGIVTIVLAAVAAIRRFKEKRVRFFTLAFGFIILLVVLNPLSSVLFTRIPILSGSSPGNMLFLSSFCLSILAGYGIDAWKKDGISLRVLMILICLAALLLALSVGGGYPLHTKSIALAGGLLIATFGVLRAPFVPIVRSVPVRLAEWALVALLVVDLFYFFHKFNSFVPRETVYPHAPIVTNIHLSESLERVWGYAGAGIEPNFETVLGLYSPDGYDPLYPRHYGEFIASSENGSLLKSFDTHHRSDAVVAKGSGETDLAANLFRLRVLDTLGVSYILDRVENGSTQVTFPPERFDQVLQDNGWRVYENKKAVPRVRLVQDYALVSTKDEFEHVFFSDSHDSAKSVILSEEITKSFEGCTDAQSVEISSYKPTVVEIAVDTPCAGILALSDTYMPGWRAFVGTEEVRVYRSDWAFRAIVVPAGSHTIRFDYAPEAFSYGLKTSILSLVLLGIWGIVVQRKHGKL